uniref:outer membrane protein n=1 Tax=Acinetobacter nosocomialis TaxID=106654 RepID=UPI0013D4EDB3
GVEYAITQNWTVRGEYLYANYGSKTFSTPAGVTPSVSLQTHKFRLGVNYLFSTGPAAGRRCRPFSTNGRSRRSFRSATRT